MLSFGIEITYVDNGSTIVKSYDSYNMFEFSPIYVLKTLNQSYIPYVAKSDLCDIDPDDMDSEMIPENPQNYVVFANSDNCPIYQKIVNSYKYNFGAVVFYPSVFSSPVGLESLYEFLQVPNTIIQNFQAFEIDSDDWLNINSSIVNQNKSMISFVIYYRNIYHEMGNNIGTIIFEIIMIVLSSATLIYGIYSFIQTIIRNDVTFVLQLIIFICCLFNLITTIIYYALDPYHSRTITTNSFGSFLVSNSIPLMVISTLIISLIWSTILKNDYDIKPVSWVKKVIITITVISVVMYPSMIIAILVFLDENTILYVITIVFFLAVIALILIFYSVNLIRIIIRMNKIDSINTDKKNYIDKFVVIILYLVLIVDLILVSDFQTVLEWMILTSLIHVTALINSFLCFFFLRSNRDSIRSRTTARGSKKTSTPSSKKSND